MKEQHVPSDYTKKMKQRIIAYGADIVGIADVEPLRSLRLDPSDLLEPFTRAVSIAVRLPSAIFEMISEQPTPIYASIYQAANRLLDDIAFQTASLLEAEDFPSLPIPASQLLDRENWHAAISHKAVARMAGLGWQGKNLLLITPKYGSRVRLTTVLTTAPLDVDGPVENRCGKCTFCQEACPVGAIKGVNTEDHYKDRDEALFFSRCVEKLTGEFAKLPDIGAPICGICIRVCPFGRKEKGTPQE